MAPTNEKTANGRRRGAAWVGPTGRAGLWAIRRYRQSPARQTKADAQATRRVMTRGELVAVVQQAEPGTAEHRAALRALRRFGLHDRWDALPPSVQGVIAIGAGILALTLAGFLLMAPIMLLAMVVVAAVMGWTLPVVPILTGYGLMRRKDRGFGLVRYLVDLWQHTARHHRRLTRATVLLQATAIGLALAEAIIRPLEGGWSLITLIMGVASAVCVTVLVVRHHHHRAKATSDLTAAGRDLVTGGDH